MCDSEVLYVEKKKKKGPAVLQVTGNVSAECQQRAACQYLPKEEYQSIALHKPEYGSLSMEMISICHSQFLDLNPVIQLREIDLKE